MLTKSGYHVATAKTRRTPGGVKQLKPTRVMDVVMPGQNGFRRRACSRATTPPSISPSSLHLEEPGDGQGLGLARARGLRGEADQRHRLLAKFPPRMSHRQDFPAEYRAICPRARESGKPPDDLQARHTRRRACLLTTSPMRGNSLPCHVLPWPRCGLGFESGERARRALLRGGLLRFHRQEARTRITLALC